ncbi:hypothetical protein HHK36_012787 [Tetracentron sinense]|uniref:AT-hook motif nuclear-localized protein n=1 Tax=Tetracentron sinense TaxID=13715 RepID=A0A834Z7F7_TETSI|nr:hypothetical protein HHK36_012787 [Tetracentron sinense]
MEGNESGLSSYYHHHPTTTNGIFSNTHYQNSSSSHFSSPEGTHLVFPPHSVTGRAPGAGSTPPETVRRKRGRPRKYGTPEAPLSSSTKKVSASPSSLPLSSPSRKKEQSLAPPSSSSKKAQLVALGNAGQGFTPHIITVAAGEDVAQKIMLFMQQHKREVCILSASGSICNASLRQPATLGGNVTYEVENL